MASAKIRQQRRIGNNGRRQHFLTAAAAMQQNAYSRNGDTYYKNNTNGVDVGMDVQDTILKNGTSAIEEEDDECFLVEVKSNGERVVYSPTEVSVPTMLSLNGRLYVIFAEEIDSLVIF